MSPRPTFRAVAAAALAALALGARPAAAEIKDRIAAVVNGQPITFSEVNERVSQELRQLEQAGIAGAELQRQGDDLRKRGLDQLIDERLVESEATTNEIDVTEEELQRQIEALAKQNRMDVTTFKEAVEAQGTSFDSLRDSLRRQALELRLLQFKVKPRKVSDEEVQAAYAQENANPEYEIRLRNIFIPEGSTAAEQAAAGDKANKAVARIRAGEEFAAVAHDLSSAPSARDGGDLGFLRRGTLWPEADRAVWELKVGEMTPLIHDQSREPAGYHLFLVAERRPIPPRPLSAEVQEEIRAKLANDSILKERESYLRSLRKAAQIDVKL